METAITKITDEDAETVYDPSEDSFLLIDTLEKDFNNIINNKSSLIMEIGSGSGIVLTTLALAYKKNKLPGHFIAVDINPNACRVTKNTNDINLTNIDIIQMDLVTALNTNYQFDIVIFNPPYVVTDTCEIYDKRLICKTWAGGKNGREIMDKLFPYLPKLISNNGIFYLVVIKENLPYEIIEIFHKLGMPGKIISDRKVLGEHLYILKFIN
ncbi:methyltransferase N6AMT1, partial [Aphidius gifuensis]|uniref:methyltransferase N6AMT1 n=1 Tax=Aphidius gifuensis TaxID=684658 RepID=UPI001CDBF807